MADQPADDADETVVAYVRGRLTAEEAGGSRPRRRRGPSSPPRSR